MNNSNVPVFDDRHIEYPKTSTLPVLGGETMSGDHTIEGDIFDRTIFHPVTLGALFGLGVSGMVLSIGVYMLRAVGCS